MSYSSPLSRYIKCMRQQLKNKPQTCPLLLKPKSTLAAPAATVIAFPHAFAVQCMEATWGKRRGSSPYCSLLPQEMARNVHMDTVPPLFILAGGSPPWLCKFLQDPWSLLGFCYRTKKYFSFWNTASPVLVAVQGREEEVCAAVACGNNLGGQGATGHL